MRPLLYLALVALPSSAFAQYTPSAGQNVIQEEIKVFSRDKDGSMKASKQKRRVAADGYGNAQGNQYDLAYDGAFDGQTIAVLDFYTGHDFSLPRAALAEKGFGVVRWTRPPPPKDLRAALKKSNQVWIIAGCEGQLLEDEHVSIIKEFFEDGHGLYIWGDNDPCLADADLVARTIFDVRVKGDLPGDRIVPIQPKSGTPGLAPNHLITTGLEHLYEGVTVATIVPAHGFEPLVYGSANNLVVAVYDQDQRRAIVDGGFTRLSYKWDSAGTGRYVKNAASWLANAERWGDAKQ